MINTLHPAAPFFCIITSVCLRIAAFHTQAAQLARLPMSHTDLIESLKNREQASARQNRVCRRNLVKGIGALP